MIPLIEPRLGAGNAEDFVQGDHREEFAAHLDQALDAGDALIMPRSTCSDSTT
jgi:hypothetical protein